MPTSPLPENVSFEQLQDQATFVRDLVRSGDEGALSMVDEFHPGLTATDLDESARASFTLSDGQLIVARLYRCASWNELRQHLGVVEAHSFTPGADRAGYVDYEESFVELACLNYAQNGPNPHDRIERAHQMLDQDPSLATGSIEAAATVGDHQTLRHILAGDPSLANDLCGPNNWPPLLYATYARIQTDNPTWSAVETVKTLLSFGADPNAGFLWKGLVPPFTALTGAIGNGESGQPWRPDRFVIARLLLEAGADPNDGQALYNNGLGGQNHDDPAHLELLLEFGLGTQQNGPWYDRLGRRLTDPVDLPYYEIEAAAIRGRPNHLRLLIEFGFDAEQPVGRSQKTAVRLAAENGNHQVLKILADAGIDTTLEPTEQFLEAIRHSNDDDLRRVVAEHPEMQEMATVAHPGAIKAVTAGGEAVLKTLIEMGFDINARIGGSGTTALHDAAQANDVPLAQLLVEHFADPNVVDSSVGATPWGWANHFQQAQAAEYLYPLTAIDDPDT